MEKFLAFSFMITAQLATAAPAFAGLATSPAVEPIAFVQPVEADCYALGEDKAAELGGTLAKANPDTEGDTPVCRVVILIPGKDGARPQRVEVVIPQ